ncbi:MAG TPA: hypothetical protein VKR58_12370, partial [Aquella sp.]|nr:hypothetical protein [Aquella sp.]
YPRERAVANCFLSEAIVCNFQKISLLVQRFQEYYMLTIKNKFAIVKIYVLHFANQINLFLDFQGVIPVYTGIYALKFF